MGDKKASAAKAAEGSATTGAQGAATKLGDMGDYGSARGQKAWGWFKKSAKPAMNYWKGLLDPDASRADIAQAIGPGIEETSKGAQQQLKNVSEFGARGGGSATAAGGIRQQQSSDVNKMILGVRPAAAEHLQSLAGLFSGTSLGETGQAVSAYKGVGDIFAKLKEIEAGKQSSGGGGGIGGAIGGLFGK